MLRAVIFANGVLNDPQSVRARLRPSDLLIAADGGLRHCLALGLEPHTLIGDFDSLEAAEVERAQAAGVQVIRHPAHKDYTDLELALRHAIAQGAQEALVLAALGARWDQTLANLLLPAAEALRSCRVTLLDGRQELNLLNAPPEASLTLHGSPGDTVSLLPLGGDAQGVTTTGLEYPLDRETLRFGETRGVSNVLLESQAQISLASGVLVCTMIHHPD